MYVCVLTMSVVFFQLPSPEYTVVEVSVASSLHQPEFVLDKRVAIGRSFKAPDLQSDHNRLPLFFFDGGPPLFGTMLNIDEECSPKFYVWLL